MSIEDIRARLADNVIKGRIQKKRLVKLPKGMYIRTNGNFKLHLWELSQQERRSLNRYILVTLAEATGWKGEV